MAFAVLSHEHIKLSAAAFRPGRHFRLLRHREPAPVGVSHTVQVESSLLHCSGIDELSNEGAKLYERQRRVILSAGMMAVHGRIQREGEVVHLVAPRVSDLSEFVASVGSRDTTCPMPHGRGDEVHGNPVLDPCSPPPEGQTASDIRIPDLHIDTIKVKARDFR